MFDRFYTFIKSSILYLCFIVSNKFCNLEFYDTSYSFALWKLSNLYLYFSQDGETTTEIEPEGESHTTVDSAVLQEGERLRISDEQDEATNVEALLSDPSSELTPQIRAAIKAKWQKIVGPDTEIVVNILRNFIMRNRRGWRENIFFVSFSFFLFK